MSDPRYRNGVFTNTRAIHSERKLARRLAFQQNHPMSWGWEFSHRNLEFDRTVYILDGAKLMFYQDNWLVEYPHIEGPVPYIGWSIKKVTEEVKKELRMFDYLETKKANELALGDFITLTGHKDEIAEIEEIYPEGDKIAVKTNDGRGKYLDDIEPVKVYTLELKRS